MGKSSSSLTTIDGRGMDPDIALGPEGIDAAAAAAACAPRLPRGAPLPAAVMVACSDVSSCIMRSFWSCLSAWTVCACWRRLSRRENCFEQWQVNGRSPVCFLERRKSDEFVSFSKRQESTRGWIVGCDGEKVGKSDGALQNEPGQTRRWGRGRSITTALDDVQTARRGVARRVCAATSSSGTTNDGSLSRRDEKKKKRKRGK